MQRQVPQEQIRVVEETDVPGPYVEEEIIEVVKHGSLERVLNNTVEQSVDVPDPLIREEIVEVIPLTSVCDEIAELNDDNKKFYEQFVKCMKLGIRENSVDDFEIAELLMFNTSKSGDEQISFKEYVDRMKEGQHDNYHITGESIAVVSYPSFLEYWRKKRYEVLYVADPVDEYAVQQLKEFDGTKLKQTTKEGLYLGDQDKKKTLEELKIESEPLRKLMKEALGDKVEEESQVAAMYGDGGNGVGTSKGVDVAARGQVDVERVRQHTGAAEWQRQPHSSKQQPTKKKRGQVAKERGSGRKWRKRKEGGTRRGEERNWGGWKGSSGRNRQGGRGGRDGLGGSQEKDQREELQDGPDLRQGEWV